MTAQTRPRLWTYSAGTCGWVGNMRRSIVLAWDVELAASIVVIVNDPRTGNTVEWWVGRQDAARGVDGPVGDWMWPCTRSGVPHVAIRPLTSADPILVREDFLGRFLARTEWFVSCGREDFAAEAAALLGGGR